MGDLDKEIKRNILSVVAGVLTTSALFVLGGFILLLVIASKVKGHGEESELGNTTLSGLFLLGFCSLAGGYVTGIISTKKDIIHSVVTGIVLLFLFTVISNFSIDKESLLSWLIIILFTFSGTYLAMIMKRKKLQ